MHPCLHIIQGARCDTNLGSIAESRLKELYQFMPGLHICAITQVRKYLLLILSNSFKDKQELRSLYECPVYKTRERGNYLYISCYKNELFATQVQPTSGPSTWKPETNLQSGFWPGWLSFCKFNQHIVNTLVLSQALKHIRITWDLKSVSNNIFYSINS